MTFVITERCTDVKAGDCVAVCPVDCIRPAPGEHGFTLVRQLYIDPKECIDCSACMTACPVDACIADDDLLPEQMEDKARNAAYFKGLDREGPR
jgi:NAD-dependent dihydropyrimidine dehydrogenase PreA subunit